MLPLNAPGSSSQCGRRNGTHNKSATHTAAPMKGKLSASSVKRTLTTTFATIAMTRIAATMNTRAQSMCTPVGGSRVIGE